MLNIALKICPSKDFFTILNLLIKYTTRAYFVGGCVRDYFINENSVDFDIEIYDIEPKKFDKIMLELGAKGVGKNYFIYKFGNFDLGLPRTESKNGVGHKAFSIKYCNDEKIASKRRDFTINSIMINIFNGKIVDFWGGRDDLKRKILRVVDENTFSEDSLRILRAVQFVSRFGLKVDKKSLEIMKNICINDLSRDRIKIELEKFFISKYQSLGIKLLIELNLDKRLFGVKFDKHKIANLVQKHFLITKDSRTFLYDIINLYDLDIKEIFNNFLLGSFYKKLLSEPFFQKASKLNMAKIALKMPLKEWLGLNSVSRVNMAKKLKIYDKKLVVKLDMQDILSLGLKGKEISSEIYMRQMVALKKYINGKI